MKSKQIVILIGALVLFGGLGAYLVKRDHASWNGTTATAGAKVLGEFDLNAVAQVEIKTPNALIHLVRKDGAWTVAERANFPASFTQIGDLIRKLWELKATEEVAAGPSQFNRLHLVEPTSDAKDKESLGTVLDLKDEKGQRIAALLLGKMLTKKSPGMPAEADGYPIGRYVMALNGRQQPVLVTENFIDVRPTADAWLNHDFIKVEKPESVSVKGAQSDVNWVLTKEKPEDEWSLYAAQPEEKLDTTKAANAVNALSAPGFSDVRAGSDQSGFETPSTITVRTFDGFIYNLKVGKPEGDEYPMSFSVTANFPKERKAGANEKPDEKTKLDADFANAQKALQEKLQAEQKLANWVYLMPKAWADQLLASRATLLQPKPTPTPALSASPSPAASATPAQPAP